MTVLLMILNKTQNLISNQTTLKNGLVETGSKIDLSLNLPIQMD